MPNRFYHLYSKFFGKPKTAIKDPLSIRPNPEEVSKLVDKLNEDKEHSADFKEYKNLGDLEKAERLTHALNRIGLQLERSRIGDYVTMMGKPVVFLRINFLAGMARGLGFGIGFALLSALLLYILHALGNWVPFFGDFVADVMVYANQLTQIK